GMVVSSTGALLYRFGVETDSNTARSESSPRWLKEHFDDPWVARAQAESWGSLASVTLLEINEKDKLFRPGRGVLDLGAAAGGWSQVAAKCVGSKGLVVASDILPMEPIADVTFLQGDFRAEDVFQKLLDILDGHKMDLVL